LAFFSFFVLSRPSFFEDFWVGGFFLCVRVDVGVGLLSDVLPSVSSVPYSDREVPASDGFGELVLGEERLRERGEALGDGSCDS